MNLRARAEVLSNAGRCGLGCGRAGKRYAWRRALAVQMDAVLALEKQSEAVRASRAAALVVRVRERRDFRESGASAPVRIRPRCLGAMAVAWAECWTDLAPPVFSFALRSSCRWRRRSVQRSRRSPSVRWPPARSWPICLPALFHRRCFRASRCRPECFSGAGNP